MILNIAVAAETDGFTSRYSPVSDGLPSINSRIQELVETDVYKLNQNLSKECDWRQLDSALGTSIRRFIYGKIEDYINNNDQVPKTFLNLSESIYHGIPSLFYVPVFIGSKMGFGFASNIHHNGLLIGADKLGHFIDEGYYFYELVHFWKLPLDKVLEMSEFSEQSISGNWTSGITSYADLAANYDGFHFWIDVLGEPTDRSKSKYFSCVNGAWKITQPIDLSVYMNAAWDEGMNCSAYRTQEFIDSISNNIKKLESRDGKRYQCPVYPERVSLMVERYGDRAKNILNPSLLR